MNISADYDEDKKDQINNTQTHNERDEHDDTISRLKSKQETYDPDQDKNLKRTIRKGYRSLIDRAEENSVDLNNVTPNQLSLEMVKANDLYNSVRAPQEATLDSRFLIVQSEMSAAKARSMKIDGDTFDMDEFLNKVINYGGGFNLNEDVGDDDDDDDRYDNLNLNWYNIGEAALNHTRRVPVMDFMLGNIPDEVPKKTKRTQQRVRKNIDDLVAPTQLREEDIQRAENETTKNVREISNLLEVHGGYYGINLFKFFINPKKFDQSVENLFYISFLIRDGQASLSMNEETNELILLACNKPTPDDYAQGLEKQQTVFELDMDTWEEAIEEYKITETIIPTREQQRQETTFKVV